MANQYKPQDDSIRNHGELPTEVGFYLYKITNNFDNMIYIGQTNNPKARRNRHNTCGGTGKGQVPNHMYNAMRKHGRKNFTYEVLLKLDREEIISFLEDTLILCYKELGTSYNSARGGKVSRGWKQSPEALRKQKVALTGKPKSEAHIESMRNRVITDDTRANISAAKKGKHWKHDPVWIATFKTAREAELATGVSERQYFALKEQYPDLDWQSKPRSKYTPEHIASFASHKDAQLATGISAGRYSDLRAKNPHLTWPPRHPKWANRK
jgi:group I intron endonuclease